MPSALPVRSGDAASVAVLPVSIDATRPSRP
jgi:hypothetical protein